MHITYTKRSIPHKIKRCIFDRLARAILWWRKLDIVHFLLNWREDHGSITITYCTGGCATTDAVVTDDPHYKTCIIIGAFDNGR